MKKSLGTLAAVAAMAATHATAAVTLSSINNLVINNLHDIDLDGDGTNDFFINGYTNYLESYSSNGIVVDVPDTNILSNLAEGITIDNSKYYDLDTSYGYLLSESSVLAGLLFQIGGNTHYGWLEFDFSGVDPLLVRGAWESTPDTGIAAGVIPEPSSVATASGLIAGTLLLLHRFRRRR